VAGGGVLRGEGTTSREEGRWRYAGIWRHTRRGINPFN